MANTLLTPDMITKECQRILHQKLNFLNRVNKSYDDRFAVSGAKIGDSLRIRLPTQYTVTDGATLNTQDSEQQSVTLQVNNRKHVGMTFTDEELTMDIDNFSKLHIEPAMAVLAANIESDVIQNVYKDVYNQVNNVGSAATLKLTGTVRKRLVDNLTPMDKTITMTCNTQDNLDIVDAGKAIFSPSQEISKQYMEGYVGRFAGFEFFENTMMPRHTSGTDDGTGDYVTNGANQTGSTLTINTGTGTLVAGDVITIADVYRVHPETKQSTGELQQFVVTATTGTSATSVSISPAIVATGAKQNVNAAAGTSKAITKVGGASAAYGISLGYHRDAFAFATADLEMPRGVHMASRNVYDGISLRFVEDFDIVNSRQRARIDVLYGYKTIRAQLACRFANN